MGSWDVTVLDNDQTLGNMSDFFNGAFQNLTDFVDYLFDHPDDHNNNQLLGVAIVDASLNGYDKKLLGLNCSLWDYKYVIFFEWLTLHPLTQYRDKALEIIDACIAEGVDDWSTEVQAERMDIYTAFKERLSKEQ